MVLPPGGTRGEALQQAGPLPNVGGQRSGHNIYLLDGVKVTDELFNNLVINPPPESVQEFKIQKSQYAAEFGGKASALINVATRAGTNALRGSAFEFLRHEQFDARGYFDPEDQPVPRLRQHQFGAALGGPLVRDRSFFFASYEGQRLRREQTRTFSVPSESARRGDLGSLQIDPDRIDPISTALLQHVPLPESPGRAPEPGGARGAAPRSRRVEPAARSPVPCGRAGVRAIQPLRRRRGAALRDERSAGGAGSRVRTPRDHPRQQPRSQPHLRVQPDLAERAAHRMDDRRRRASQPEPRRGLRGAGRS